MACVIDDHMYSTMATSDQNSGQYAAVLSWKGLEGLVPFNTCLKKPTSTSFRFVFTVTRYLTSVHTLSGHKKDICIVKV